MKPKLKKLKSFFWAHKILSIFILLVLLGGGYYAYGKVTSTAGETRYITAKVEKSTIVESTSGTGQVSSGTTIDLKPKTSGDVIYLAVKAGQRIGAGGLIAQLDAKDAQKTLRDAEINLQSAQISLNKLKIEKSTENMSADLARSYEDGFNSVSGAYLDLPGIMSGLNDMFFKSAGVSGQQYLSWYEGQVPAEDHDRATSFKQNFEAAYNKALTSFNQNFDTYKSISRSADPALIEKLITDTYNTITLISDAIKSGNNYIDFVQNSMERHNFDVPTIIATHKNLLSSYTSKTNTHLTNLLSNKTDIKNYKDAFLNSDLDIEASELTVKQKENAVQDAKDKLADYYVRAPFSGTISTLTVKKSDSVSASTTLGTLITTEQVAEISMNEVDVAKIKLGDKATLTFDAVPDLSILGTVAEIDTVGTVEQGVVTYNVKISFNSQDVRVKPAMSVSASIVTNTKESVLAIPNSALKSQGGGTYVEIFDPPLPPSAPGLIGSLSSTPPKRMRVEVGIANDKETEIVSGLSLGDEVVVRTIVSGAATPARAAAPTLFGSPTRGTTSGGGARFQAR